MAVTEDSASMPVWVAAADCGKKVAVVALCVAVLIVAVGWIWEHSEGVCAVITNAWLAVLWAFSLGGQSTWFSIVGGLTSIAIFFWVMCVGTKMGTDDSESPPAFQIWGGVASVMSWLLFFSATQASVEVVADLSTYATIAYYLLWMPVVSLVLLGVGVFMLLLHNA